MVLSCSEHVFPRFIWYCFLFSDKLWYFYHIKVVTWKLQHFYHKEIMMGVGKNTPGKNSHPEKSPRENCPLENCPRKYDPQKNWPPKIAPWKNAPQENCPRKIVLLDFCWFWHYLSVVPFKTCYSFRDVSRTPATSTIACDSS